MPIIHSLDSFVPGDTVLAPMGPEDHVHWLWGDTAFSFVLFRREPGGVRQLDQAGEGPLFQRVESVYAMRSGHFMVNLEHEGRKRFAINGELWPVPDSKVWLVNRDGKPLWTRGGSAEEYYPSTTWVGMRQQEHPFYDQPGLGPDRRTFLYSAASWPDYLDFRFIRDGEVFYDGSLYDLIPSPDWKHLSWIGSPEDAETSFMYLRGNPSDAGYEYIEPWSFDVCSEHRHFMFAAGSASLDNGVSMMVDGVMQPERFENIQLWGNWFFDDPAHWFYCGIDSDDRHHVIKDGRTLGVHAQADGYAELPGNRLAYLAEEGEAGSGWSARVDGGVAAMWPYALPLSLKANARGDLAYVVDLEKGGAEEGWGRMALVVNHEPVWTFDRPALHLPKAESDPAFVAQFDSDDLVRCLGVKNDSLVMHTHRL